MGIFIFWLLMAIICGVIGANRKVGAFGGFLLGFFLSIIGLVIVLNSKRLEDVARDSAILQSMSQKELVQPVTTADELQKLAQLHATKAINDEEYELLKAKLINI